MHGIDTHDAPAPVAWRKSSYSGASNGNCLEVFDGFPGSVPVRDSKDVDGPVLTFGVEAFAAFTGAVRNGTI
ncbi:DUF397 domain-containing protein [Streptomyces iconiensis]|uniref:DUF397 domain-containing protein n=1 Tax=Streptomyces iconiensis TaxID=1384038 RepID=A0ABT6ZUU8_9ACTN|nr:DUF397 domain-containing protein [Streptomyces iconiensis]MDJ1132842.1 DUF397 domain-containing protein [Streptomyces iconiensis]